MTRSGSAIQKAGMSTRAVLTITCLALVLAATACKKESAPKQTPPKAAAKQTPPPPQQHAPEGAKPGSYEDWCGGHQVPESLCTRCNAGLIPAFKATGDWCEGHGLPESQCLKCNPGLKIGRPPKAKSN